MDRSIALQFAHQAHVAMLEHWKTNALALVLDCKPPETRSVWDKTLADGASNNPAHFEPVLALELEVLARVDGSGNAELCVNTVGEHLRSYVRLEATGRLAEGQLTVLLVKSHEADEWEGAAINALLDRRDELVAEGWTVVLSPEDED